MHYIHVYISSLQGIPYSQDMCPCPVCFYPNVPCGGAGDDCRTCEAETKGHDNILVSPQYIYTAVLGDCTTQIADKSSDSTLDIATEKY